MKGFYRLLPLLLCAIILITACNQNNPIISSTIQSTTNSHDHPSNPPADLGCEHPEESLTTTILHQDCAHTGMMATICMECNAIVKKEEVAPLGHIINIDSNTEELEPVITGGFSWSASEWVSSLCSGWALSTTQPYWDSMANNSSWEYNPNTDKLTINICNADKSEIFYFMNDSSYINKFQIAYGNVPLNTGHKRVVPNAGERDFTNEENFRDITDMRTFTASTNRNRQVLDSFTVVYENVKSAPSNSDVLAMRHIMTSTYGGVVYFNFESYTEPVSDSPSNWTHNQECQRCGTELYVLEAGKTITFANIEASNIKFEAQATKGTQLLKLSVDGVQHSTIECKTNSVAFDVTTEENELHHYQFTNNGTETVLIWMAAMDEKLYAPGDVLLEIMPSSGDLHSSFYIYVRTSDESGLYYVRYNMILESNNNRDIYKSNSTSNVYNYRIRTAQLVKIHSVKDDGVEFSNLFEVLTSGEISLAVKQNQVDMNTITPAAQQMLQDASSTEARDFVGGFHGDEYIESVKLLADGVEIALKNVESKKVLSCSNIQFKQTTTIYAWGTSTSDSYGRKMMSHSQDFRFTADGVNNRQSVTWLDDGFHLNQFYMQMFTMRRETDEGKLVCESFETFDENGNSLGKYTTNPPVTEIEDVLSNMNNRLVKYSSSTSGVSAEAGFTIIDDSVKVNEMHIKLRTTQLDNKLYVSFESPKNGRSPQKGEVWTVETFYNIDYQNSHK